MACHKCGAPKPGGAGRDRRDRGAPRGRTGAEEPEFRRDFAGTRCFVENLSYETDWALLKDSFLDEGYPVVYCSVSTDQYTGESKGHGIVQFETVHAAKHAIEHMTGFELDGRRINVREDYQDKRRRDSSAESGATAEDAAVRGGGGAARREAWKDRGVDARRGQRGRRRGGGADRREGDRRAAREARRRAGGARLPHRRRHPRRARSAPRLRRRRAPPAQLVGGPAGRRRRRGGAAAKQPRRSGSTRPPAVVPRGDDRGDGGEAFDVCATSRPGCAHAQARSQEMLGRRGEPR